ncbi:MAG TPA: PA0069 family radical SAM protein [Casimicrobiaceae bacterium]
MAASPPRALKGRGATFNPGNRYRRDTREAVDDGWSAPPDESGEPPPLRTTVTIQNARTIIAHNDSPDIPFERSINPYQGCEHGCVYCYARPTHAYLDLSPGVDFETRLFAKPEAARLLRAELSRPGYRCQPIALGTNTDPYQPIEREWKITRQIIEVLAACEHPLTITTKGVLIERDLDLLAPMAAKNLVRAYVSIAMLDGKLARKLDPRAPSPQRRLEMIRALSAAGVPVGVSVAPVIPQLTDKDLEAVLEAAAAHGARAATWVMLRLPREVKDLFRDWLAQHYPLRAAHVMSIVQQVRGGRDNDPQFGSRMRGQGQFADLIARRFAVACKRLGLNEDRTLRLDTTRFRAPRAAEANAQLELFG